MSISFPIVSLGEMSSLNDSELLVCSPWEINRDFSAHRKLKTLVIHGTSREDLVVDKLPSTVLSLEVRRVKNFTLKTFVKHVDVALCERVSLDSSLVEELTSGVQNLQVTSHGVSRLRRLTLERVRGQRDISQDALDSLEYFNGIHVREEMPSLKEAFFYLEEESSWRESRYKFVVDSLTQFPHLKKLTLSTGAGLDVKLNSPRLEKVSLKCRRLEGLTVDCPLREFSLDVVEWACSIREMPGYLTRVSLEANSRVIQHVLKGMRTINSLRLRDTERDILALRDVQNREVVLFLPAWLEVHRLEVVSRKVPVNLKSFQEENPRISVSYSPN